MTTPSDALYTALTSRAPQTTRELTRGLARLGQKLLLSSDVERLLLADPRLRNDGGQPLRWRALPIGQAPPLAGPPTPRKAPPRVVPRRTDDKVALQLLDPHTVVARVSPVAAFWGQTVVVAAEPLTHEPVLATEVSVVRRPPLPPGSTPRYVGPRLRQWQADTLDGWLAHKRRGVVQSVAAAGRTGVGVLAAWDGVTRGEKVLVVVPHHDLQEHWLRTLELQLPGLSLGRRGDGSTHTFDDCDVLVSLASAADADLLPDGAAGLIVADEVHRFGTGGLAATLTDRFNARLGLTVGLDGTGADEVVASAFGAALDGCTLRRGSADAELARFRVGLVPVELLSNERDEYRELTARIDVLAARLVATHGCDPETFLDDTARLQAAWSDRPDAATDASAYLRAVNERRLIAASSVAKLEALPRLGQTLARHARSLVYTHSAQDAEIAATLLQDNGVDAERFPHGRPQDVRLATVRDLRAGELRALTAHRPLSTGTELPAVTTVVLLAGARTSRQLVERVDPALRPNRSDTISTVLIVYARGTTEEPGQGHLTDLLDAAAEVRTFGLDTEGATIAAWSVGL